MARHVTSLRTMRPAPYVPFSDSDSEFEDVMTPVQPRRLAPEFIRMVIERLREQEDEGYQSAAEL